MRSSHAGSSCAAHRPVDVDDLVVPRRDDPRIVALGRVEARATRRRRSGSTISSAGHGAARQIGLARATWARMRSPAPSAPTPSASAGRRRAPAPATASRPVGTGDDEVPEAVAADQRERRRRGRRRGWRPAGTSGPDREVAAQAPPVGHRVLGDPLDLPAPAARPRLAGDAAGRRGGRSRRRSRTWPPWRPRPATSAAGPRPGSRGEMARACSSGVSVGSMRQPVASTAPSARRHSAATWRVTSALGWARRQRRTMDGVSRREGDATRSDEPTAIQFDRAVLDPRRVDRAGRAGRRPRALGSRTGSAGPSGRRRVAGGASPPAPSPSPPGPGADSSWAGATPV